MLALILVQTACSFFAGRNQRASDSSTIETAVAATLAAAPLPTLSPEPTQELNATLTPRPTSTEAALSEQVPEPGPRSETETHPAPTGEVIFEDNFSDPSSGFQTLRDEGGIIDYENDAFRIYINQPDYDYWSINHLGLGDVRIEVDATKVDGPNDNDFGVICRYQDADNFYAFLISSDGYYGISKMSDGDHNIIGAESMEYSTRLPRGSVTNRITAECNGNTLSLYVNGVKLTEVEDREFSSGGIGLIAGTFTETGVDISFDNLVVTRP